MQIQNHERNKELYLAYKKAYAREDVRSVKDAINVARNSRASQFYVSSDTAWRYVCSRINGNKLNKSRNSHYIFEMIYKKFLRLRKLEEFKGSSNRFVFSFALASEAPSFFVTYRWAYHIIRSMSKNGIVEPRKRYDKKKADTK